MQSIEGSVCKRYIFAISVERGAVMKIEIFLDLKLEVRCYFMEYATNILKSFEKYFLMK